MKIRKFMAMLGLFLSNIASSSQMEEEGYVIVDTPKEEFVIVDPSLDKMWQLFDQNTPEVIRLKIEIIESAYQKTLKEITAIIDGRALSSLSFNELVDIKDRLSNSLGQIKKVEIELYTTIVNGSLPPDVLYSTWNQEWEANRLGPPEEYYPMLGYETWQDGVKAPFDEVRDRLEKELQSDETSEEQKKQLRQLTYYFFSKSKKEQLDLLLRARNASNDEERNTILREASLGEEANDLIDRFSQIAINDALMELKTLEDSVKREIRTR